MKEALLNEALSLKALNAALFCEAPLSDALFERGDPERRVRR